MCVSMLLASAAACNCFFDVGIRVWPEQCHACTRTALFGAEMSFVYAHQHFFAHCFRDDNETAADLENHSIMVRQFVSDPGHSLRWLV